MSVGNGVLPFEQYFLVLSCNLFAYATYKEFPVFRPNEYFWKNHVKEGEEKADAYCRVMREFLASEMDMPLSEFSFRDKIEYRAKILGKGMKATD